MAERTIHPRLERARLRLEQANHDGWWDRIEHRYRPTRFTHRAEKREYRKAWDQCHAETMTMYEQNEGRR